MGRRLSARAAKQAETYFTKLGEEGKQDKGGRPPIADNLTDVLIHELRPSRRVALARRLIENALGGNQRAIEYIYDRIEGKPHQHITEKRDGEDPIVRLLEQVQRERYQEIIEGEVVLSLEPVAETV